jgi:TonB family protein
MQVNTARVGDGVWPPVAVPARAGGKVEGPRLLSGGRPPYPPDAARRGAEGTVALSATIKSDGAVDAIVTLAAPGPELEAAARADFQKWRYAPMTLNGQPVDCGITLVLTYKLR